MLSNIIKAQLVAFLTQKLANSAIFNAGVAATHQSVTSLQSDIYAVLEKAVANGSGQKVVGNRSPPPNSPTSRDNLKSTSQPRRGSFERTNSTTRASPQPSTNQSTKPISPIIETGLEEREGETEDARRLRLFINKMKADINKNQ